MKSKKWLVSSLVAGGCLLVAMPADAAVVGSMNTDLSIGFGTETQTPNPNPALPNSSSLRSVPSSLSFGENNSVETGSGMQVVNLQGGGTRYVAVKDTRTGSNTWKVTAKASVLTDGGTSKFDGSGNYAKVSFSNVARAYQGSSTPGTGNNITALVGNPGDPIADATVTITADDSTSSDILKSATAGTPAGGWASELTNIQLTIPKGVAYEGAEYTGTITWTLDDTL